MHWKQFCVVTGETVHSVGSEVCCTAVTYVLLCFSGRTFPGLSLTTFLCPASHGCKEGTKKRTWLITTR